MEEIKSSEEIFGGRLLRDLEESEESLESLLTALTDTLVTHPPRTHVPSLDLLWSQSYQNQSKLSVSGRQLPLLIHILTTLLRGSGGRGGKCVVLIDVRSSFSPSFLPFENDDASNEEEREEEQRKLKKSDLKHLHIFRPSAQKLECTLIGIEKYMLYGDHESYGREFGGTILFGFDARDAGGNGVGNVKGMGRPEIVMGWRGWLRVEREEVLRFGLGVSAEEMLGERERRVEICRGKGWRGRGDKGGEAVWKLE
ncbi:hypothetical protein SBOR_5148 [Sclerotinia borealis F-4128]|uniref:Uncharacterized protein n=1 Tax=Sclerotinia borealis (strain F-4128) TaxID=1432307 RepID=W9CIT1_SCLBF|nr:hypothetical protein SBOR_5148 [Sclerotinia borealis F-4128]